MHRAKSWPWVVMVAGLPVALLIAICTGRVAVDPSFFWRWMTADGAFTPGSDDATAYAVITALRLPRAALAVAAGAGLAMAGAALQGALRNPLAGPQTVGVLGGAGAGGTLALLIYPQPWFVVVVAFAGGLVSIAAVLWLARIEQRVTVLSVILAGIIVGSLFTALIALMQFVADPDRQLPNLVFWLMGSLAAATYGKAALVGAIALAMGAWMTAVGFRLNVLCSGDDEALALGVNAPRLRIAVLAAVALTCAAVVATCGLVAWVGLVVPHIARLLVGHDHRVLIPCSALIGAVFVLLVDTLCRSMTAAEIPLGALTAVVGAPLFAILIKRNLSALGTQ